jgi:arylsulfatase A-like enzyme
MTPAALNRVKSYYYGMVELNDKAIGNILSELHRLGLDDNTVVVFNADHGEMLGDHGLLFKGAYMYDQVLRTPLIMRAPGRIQPGATVDKLVEEIDVLPTVLDLLGVPAPDGVQGVNLLTDRKKQAVFAEFPTIKMVRTLEWKLVHYPGAKHGELYDLKTDPHELFNLWADPKYAAQRAEMAGLLADWLIRSQDRKLGPVRDPSEKG